MVLSRLDACSDQSRNPSLGTASLDATPLKWFGSGTAISAPLRLGYRICTVQVLLGDRNCCYRAQVVAENVIDIVEASSKNSRADSKRSSLQFPTWKRRICPGNSKKEQAFAGSSHFRRYKCSSGKLKR